MSIKDFDPDYIAYAEERGEQIREDRLDDLGRCEASLEAYIKRNGELAQLCRDMFTTIDDYCVTVEDRDRYFARMEQLGLLGGER